MLNTPALNKHNIFQTPLNKTEFLVYAPLKNHAFIAQQPEIIALENHFIKNHPPVSKEISKRLQIINNLEENRYSSKTVTDTTQFDRMFVIPTNKCNFSCSYCFSAKGRSKSTMDFKTLKTGIDYFIRKEKNKSKYLSIAFVGGGEPLLNMELLKKGIEYSALRAKDYGYSMNYSIITNGSKINQDIIQILLKHKVTVTVSFEIIEEIQNAHRGHYNEVRNAIEMLLDAGVYTRVRATITPKNVDLQPRMITMLTEMFPSLKEAFFENVTDRSIDNIDEFKKFHTSFISNFFEAQDIAMKRNCALMCSAWQNAGIIKERYCPGYLILNPDGNIGLCNRITSPLENGYTDVCYGNINESGVNINTEKFDKLIHFKPNYGCDQCFAKWHCNGGCLGQKYNYNDQQMAVVCEFTRGFIKEYVLKNLIKNEHAYTKLN